MRIIVNALPTGSVDISNTGRKMQPIKPHRPIDALVASKQREDSRITQWVDSINRRLEQALLEPDGFPLVVREATHLDTHVNFVVKKADRYQYLGELYRAQGWEVETFDELAVGRGMQHHVTAPVNVLIFTRRPDGLEA